MHFIVGRLQGLQLTFCPFNLNFGLTQLIFALLQLSLQFSHLSFFGTVSLTQLSVQETLLLSQQLNVSLSLFPLIFKLIHVNFLLKEFTFEFKVAFGLLTSLLLQLVVVLLDLIAFTTLNFQFASKIFHRTVIATL